MGYMTAFNIGSSALAAQRLRLDIISNNIANAESTNTTSGSAFQRQDVIFSAIGQQQTPFGSLLPFNTSSNSSFDNSTHNASLSNSSFSNPSASLNGVQVNKIVTDTAPGTKVYDPTHPDADAQGYVTYPNVNMVVEMTNMLSASRSYEAGLSIVDAARSMAIKAIDIGNA